jgi:5-methylthioadenosine/S-adenosylhomocysteine deaminase
MTVVADVTASNPEIKHITGLTIIAVDGKHGTRPFVGDIVITGSEISHVGPSIETPVNATRIHGQRKLAIPGLVNAHLHSFEALYKGRYDNLPLELWALFSCPILVRKPLAARLIYLRSMLAGMEALKNGVTTIVDDVIELPSQDMQAIDAVFQAYADLGIRANVSGHMMDRPFVDTLPYLHHYLPRRLADEIYCLPVTTPDMYADFARAVVRRYHDYLDRLRFFVAPSGPQRCTPEMLQQLHELAAEFRCSYHIHVLETKVQAITGHRFYGMTLVEYLNSLGVMSQRCTLAHSIWVNERDIETIAKAGASVVHNPVSNLKLGAGIAPLRRFLDVGINVGLGSDGLSSSDTSRMTDVMKAAALLHNVTEFDYERWPRSSEILFAATMGGARSAAIEHSVGSIEVGKKADLVLYDLESINFSPLNDLANHLVYCENGASIDAVFVNGEIVCSRSKLLRVDEAEILRELRELYPEFLEHHKEVEALNRRFFPYFDNVYKRCCAEHLEHAGFEASGWIL